MLNMAFSMTTQQVRDQEKDITRRYGWHHLTPGMVVMAIEKGQGLKKGEKVKYLGPIKIISVAFEELQEIERNPKRGERTECEREGFPHLTASQFVAMFLIGNPKATPTSTLARIEFAYIERRHVADVHLTTLQESPNGKATPATPRRTNGPHRGQGRAGKSP